MTAERSGERYAIRVDTHCHTYASFHAMCSLSDVVNLGKKRGLQAVAITDHHPSIDTPDRSSHMRGPDFAYFHVLCDRFENLDEEIEVLKGIELNILDHEPWLSEISHPVFDQLDLRLAGVHVLDHLFRRSDKNSISKSTEAILNAMHCGSSRPFEIMSHPIIHGVCFDHQSVIRAAKERGIALELNNSLFPNERTRRKARHDPDQLRCFFEKVAEEGAYIAVGSDAHVPNEVGRFDAATAFLWEMDFPERLIINRSLADLQDFCRKTRGQG
jgi:putative hydrolase